MKFYSTNSSMVVASFPSTEIFYFIFGEGDGSLPTHQKDTCKLCWLLFVFSQTLLSNSL